VYALFYFALGYVRYAAHRNFVDLGIFAQTAASAFGCFCNTIEGSHWAFHFSPVLYVAGALIRVWPSALSLVALQAVAGALTIPPVYGIVARHMDRHSARLAAAVVFLYPPLAGAIFNDFHENGLAAAAVAWLLWAFDGGSIAWTILFALLALSIKEDQAIFLTVAGALAFLRYRSSWPRGPLALVIACVSAAVALKFFYGIQPHAAPFDTLRMTEAWAPVRFYSWTAQDIHALLPRGIIERIGFLLLAFVPLLFLPFRTRAITIAILPFAEVLCSRMSTTFTMGSHYAGAWAGYIFFAFACALRPIYARDPARAYRILYWCIGLCVAEFAAADPLHPGYFLHGRTAADAQLDAFAATLPATISLSTQEELYTHLAATNPNVTLLPETPQQTVTTCYILTDEAFPSSPRLVESKPLVQRLTASHVYQIVRRDGEITLYKRTAGCP
jgi:uncharacterized membrane protein